MKKYIIEPKEGISLAAAAGVTLTKTFEYAEIFSKLIRIDLLWKTNTTFSFTTFTIKDINGNDVFPPSGVLAINTMNTWNLINVHSGTGTAVYMHYNAAPTNKGISFLSFDQIVVRLANSGAPMTGEIYIVAYTSEEDSD